jgi:hypothetical protein
MEWWDQVWLNLQLTFPPLWITLPDVADNAINFAKLTFSVIAEYLGAFLAVALYFPIRMLNIIIDLINIVLGSLMNAVNSIIILGNLMVTLITGTFNNVLPDAWVAAFGIIILLNIALRVYYFVKDIEILGNKI